MISNFAGLMLLCELLVNYMPDTTCKIYVHDCYHAYWGGESDNVKFAQCLKMYAIANKSYKPAPPIKEFKAGNKR